MSLQAQFHQWLPCRSGREAVSEHWQATDGIGPGDFVLQDIPMLDEKTILDADDVGGDPGYGTAVPGKPAMCDDKVAFRDNDMVFIMEFGGRGFDQIEQAVS